MAINTETKRRSVQAYTMGLLRPVADGSITVGDRATVAWLYAADSYPSPPTPGVSAEDGNTVRANVMANVRANARGNFPTYWKIIVEWLWPRARLQFAT